MRITLKRWIALGVLLGITLWQRDEVGAVLAPMLARLTASTAPPQSPVETNQAPSRAPVDGEPAPAVANVSGVDGAPTDESRKPTPPDPPESAPPLSAAEARKAMLKLWLDQDCSLVQGKALLTAMESRERQWRWLPPDLASAEHQAMDGAVARLSADCPPAPANDAERARQNVAISATLAAALRADDLYARLEPSSRGRVTPELLRQWAAELRATLYDAVLSGDPEAIARLGWLDLYVQSTQPSSINLYANPFDLWPLVACDLGLDCGPGSRVLDRACMHQGVGCGYSSYEAYARDNLSPSQFQATDQRRREIVTRIRSGQVAGLFDPPPPPNAGGKP